MYAEALTVREAAQRAKVSQNTIRRWIREGRLKAHIPGERAFRISDRDLERFLLGDDLTEAQG